MVNIVQMTVNDIRGAKVKWWNQDFHQDFLPLKISKTRKMVMPVLSRFLFLFFFTTALFGQGYLMHHYTEMDGLPTANVHDMVQDNRGRIWFATRGGIAVYDSVSWKTFRLADGLPVLPFHHIQVDQKGRIWAISHSQSNRIIVVYYEDPGRNDQVQWHRIQEEVIQEEITGINRDKSRGITSFQLVELEQDTADKPILAVGTANAGIFLWYREKWENLTIKNGLLSNSVNGFASLEQKLYAATDKGLSIIDIHPNNNPGHMIDIEIDNRLNRILDFPLGKIDGIGIQYRNKYPDSHLKHHRVWLYNHEWLGYFDADHSKIIHFPVKIPLTEEKLHLVHLLPDYRCGVYVSNRVSINYFNYSTHSWEPIHMKSGLISEGANSMFVDFEKNIWIACERGVNKIPSRRFTNIRMIHGLLEDEVSAVMEIEQGKFVLGHNNGITIYDGNQFQKIPLPQKKSRHLLYRVLDMQLDSKGIIWLAMAWAGLGKIDPDSPYQATWYGKLHGLPENIVCLWIDRQTDNIWVGTNEGIFFRKNSTDGNEQKEKFERINLGDFPPPQVRKIYGSSGKLRYIAGNTCGIFVHEEVNGKSQWKNYQSPGNSKANNVYAIKKDSRGRLFVGTLDGLLILENDTLKKFKYNGFQVDRPVYFIQEDRKKRLWFGTNNGVVRWDGKTGRIFTTAEGLSGLETNRSAGILDSRGRIWIGTNRGVSVYQEEFEDNESVQPQPKIQLLTLETPDKTIPLTGNQPIRLAYKENNLGLHFRGISFLDEKAVRFKHWLEGFDKEWSKEQYHYNQMIRYTNLPPGVYCFHLQAKNASGVWSDKITSREIIILKPFYKTRWFYLLLILAAGIIFFVIFQFILEKHNAALLEKEVKERTTQLQAVEQRYRRLFEESKDVVFITTPEGKIIDVNPAGVALLGFRSREEMLSLESLDPYYVNPDDRTRFRKEIEQNGYLKDFELTYQRKDGQLITTLETVSVERDEAGKIVAYRGIARDITGQKKLEEQLIQARKMEAIGTLAGGIAHDFNNILAVIMGQAELVIDELHEEVSRIEGAQIDWIRNSAGNIVTAADRGADLVKQILTFSRQSKREREPINLSTIIKDSLRLLRSILPATIEIHQDIQASSYFVLADPTQIRQVMLNFGTNSAHAMRESGGSLEVILREVFLDAEMVKSYNDIQIGNYQKLTIRDTGHGMSPKILKRIFEPYFTTKQAGEGTGMGLAVIHGIVKSHGGDILVQSQPDKGTVFQVLFPCIVSNGNKKIEKTQLTGETPGGSERILLVDDETQIVDAVSQMLKKKGYQVKGISDPVEALSIIRKEPNRFDLVISDVTMPHMTGMQLAREVKYIKPDIPIILCSGFGSIISEEEIKILGVDDFIIKPINVSNLTRVIRNVLDNRD